MHSTLRPLDPALDYPGLASLLNQVQVEPVTVAILHEGDQRAARERIIQRQIVVTDDGQVIGYSLVVHEPWSQAGGFYLWVAVDTSWRKQGLGALLYADALRFAQGQEATVIESRVREDHAEGLRFAEQRGFTMDRHLFESVLDLSTFDEQRFAGVISVSC